MINTRTKLIEVSLPLDDINAASTREKSIRHGHPSTLHLWWARRPLAAARAVIFAQMVDDPSSVPEEFPTARAQTEERERLFGILRELVKWENIDSETVYEKAKAEIRRSWRRTCADNSDHPRASELFDPENPPAFHDPFAGGGALPLEAQRLGMEAHASDLNPVAVLINKAMIEIPPKFAGMSPVNPDDRAAFIGGNEWPNSSGLAADVRYYGQWMKDEAKKRIGHLYPKVKVTTEMAAVRPDLRPYVDQKLTVVAWLWARTVKSPNPAFADVDVPLVSSFVLSSKKGKEAYVEPIIANRGFEFTVRNGIPPKEANTGTKSAGSGSQFLCLLSDSPISFKYIRTEAKLGRMGSRLLAIVAEGNRERIFLNPSEAHRRIANEARPSWQPEASLPDKALGFRIQEYGMAEWSDLFTRRQLSALTTFSDLVSEAQDAIVSCGLSNGVSNDETPLANGGTGALAYAEAVGVYLAMAVDKAADHWSTICRWRSSNQIVTTTFGRQAIPMVWDFGEANPFSNSSGNWESNLHWIGKVLDSFRSFTVGIAKQQSATIQKDSQDKIVSTDPPYYDNIGYADLSDFFYVWLRRTLKSTYADLFATVTSPKHDELIASPYRQGSRDAAERFFLDGMSHAIKRIAEQSNVSVPVTLFYAFKQSETMSDSGRSSTGWETFLEAVISSGFGISGTWPIRTELRTRLIGMHTNSLASSIILVCRKRDKNAPLAIRREFVTKLRDSLEISINRMQSGNIAPVDLAQAAIGPGISVYTSYERLYIVVLSVS